MNLNELTELCSKVFISWNLVERNAERNGVPIKSNEEYNSKSFIAKVLRKKMEVFEVPVNIPDHMLVLIELCTEGNPGIAQLMLKEVLSRIPNLKPDYTIQSTDFARVYCVDFPIVEIPQWREYFEKLWGAQKDSNGNNMCDTVEWWTEVFK